MTFAFQASWSVAPAGAGRGIVDALLPKTCVRRVSASPAEEGSVTSRSIPAEAVLTPAAPHVMPPLAASPGRASRLSEAAQMSPSIPMKSFSKRRGDCTPQLPRQLQDQLQSAAAALLGLRVRWNRLLHPTTTDGDCRTASVLVEAQQLYDELDHLLWAIYSANEAACLEAADTGREPPVPRQLREAIGRANLNAGTVAEHWLDLYLPAARRGGHVSHRVLRSLARAFDGLVGCLADILGAAYIASLACDDRDDAD